MLIFAPLQYHGCLFLGWRQRKKERLIYGTLALQQWQPPAHITGISKCPSTSAKNAPVQSISGYLRYIMARPNISTPRTISGSWITFERLATRDKLCILRTIGESRGHLGVPSMQCHNHRCCCHAWSLKTVSRSRESRVWPHHHLLHLNKPALYSYHLNSFLWHCAIPLEASR